MTLFRYKCDVTTALSPEHHAHVAVGQKPHDTCAEA